MKIKTFEYRDLDTGWHLNVMDFDQINLLVGASGVGKTKIPALSLLEPEAVIQPIAGELNRIAVIEARPDIHVAQRSVLDDVVRYIYPEGKLDIMLREPRTRRAHPTLLAYMINRLKPEKFARIRDPPRGETHREEDLPGVARAHAAEDGRGSKP